MRKIEPYIQKAKRLLWGTFFAWQLRTNERAT
jgi:hypothetical protein